MRKPGASMRHILYVLVIPLFVATFTAVAGFLALFLAFQWKRPDLALAGLALITISATTVSPLPADLSRYGVPQWDTMEERPALRATIDSRHPARQETPASGSPDRLTEIHP